MNKRTEIVSQLLFEQLKTCVKLLMARILHVFRSTQVKLDVIIFNIQLKHVVLIYTEE